MVELPIERRKQLAAAMISTGATVRETAKQAGICQDTVIKVKRDKELLNSPEVEHLRKTFGTRVLMKAGEALEHLTPDKLAASSGDQLGRIIDTLHKTHRRETGQSTENISLTAGLARGLDDDE